MDILEVRTLAGVSAKDAYYAAVEALPKAGIPIWKKRDFGWFAIGRRGSGATEITANIMSKMGKETTLELRLTGAAASEEELKALAEEFFRALDGLLKK